MSRADREFLGPAQEALYHTAGQDMPVGYDEVEKAMNDYTRELIDALLFPDMIEQHRPILRRDPFSRDPNMRAVQCPACDGDVWCMTLIGRDEIPECRFWVNAKNLGLVKNSSSSRGKDRDEEESISDG
jgi:hypothetical protein